MYAEHFQGLLTGFADALVARLPAVVYHLKSELAIRGMTGLVVLGARKWTTVADARLVGLLLPRLKA